MPRDEPFIPPSITVKPPRSRARRVVPMSYYAQAGSQSGKPLFGHKFTQSGTLENIRVDVEGVEGEGLLVFVLRKAGTKVNVNHESVLKPGSMNLGNFDVGARDELRVFVQGGAEVSEIFFTADYVL